MGITKLELGRIVREQSAAAQWYADARQLYDLAVASGDPRALALTAERQALAARLSRGARWGLGAQSILIL